MRIKGFKQLSVGFILLCVQAAKAEMNYSLDLRSRTRPSALNLVGTMASDHLLWGEANKQNPMYGYWRWGLRAGGSPSYAGFVQVAPIAPVIFEVQKGSTHRFLKISSLDCDSIDCKGRVDRTDYVVRLLGATGDFLFSATGMWREIQTADSLQPVGLEYEFFTVTPGFHRYFEGTLVAGYKLVNGDGLTLISQSGFISEGDRRFSSWYATYRWKTSEILCSAGIGQYKSDQPGQDGMTGVFTASYSWGERLSLF